MTDSESIKQVKVHRRVPPLVHTVHDALVRLLVAMMFAHLWMSASASEGVSTLCFVFAKAILKLGVCAAASCCA